MGIFKMPSLGADMEAGKLAEWLIKPGDTVKRGDIVAVVETQKGAIEIECFEEGTVSELTADIGAELPVGAPIAVILKAGETPPQQAAAPAPEAAPAPMVEPAPVSHPEPASIQEPQAPEPGRRPVPPPVQDHAASPAARIRAQEKSVDLATLTGSGPGGVIVLADVEAAAPAAPQKPEKKTSPMEEMRKAIAAAMVRSKQTIPHFYLSETIDVQPAMDWVEDRNADKPPTKRILLGALFVRAATLAASKVKQMNGHWVDGAFKPADQVNPGVAVALRGGGLVAPALIDAVPMTLEQTMDGMRDLVGRARAGRLRSREMTEGTITISALGETGAEAMTGVIFPPQVSIVGIGAPHLRPWVVDGAVTPRHVITLTLSADHRVSDGRVAAKYIAEFETLIASPEAL